FVDADELPSLYHCFKHNRGKVVVAAAFGGVSTAAFHSVVHAAAKHQSRALRPVAQNRPKALASGSGGVEHAADEAFGEARVGGVNRQRLPVRKLRGDHDLGVGIFGGEFVFDRRQVTVGERDKAHSSQTQALTRRCCPEHIAPQG